VAGRCCRCHNDTLLANPKWEPATQKLQTAVPMWSGKPRLGWCLLSTVGILQHLWFCSEWGSCCSDAVVNLRQIKLNIIQASTDDPTPLGYQCLHHHSHHFYARWPSCHNPHNLSWIGTGTGLCWIAKPVAWFVCIDYVIKILFPATSIISDNVTKLRSITITAEMYHYKAHTANIKICGKF